jgi:hypothetical protein
MSRSIASHSLPSIHDISGTDRDLGGDEVELNLVIPVTGPFTID